MSAFAPEMSSTLVHFSHPKHPLLLTDTIIEECVVTGEDVTCCECHLPFTKSPAFTFTRSGETSYVHKRCFQEDDDDTKCVACNKSVLSSPRYACTKDDYDCESFYLHKSCAELPMRIYHQKHNQHSLSLLPRHACVCKVCRLEWEFFTYTCDDCQFNVCVSCASEQRVLRHPGHQEHTLTLMHREALFKCDACEEEAKDTSYVCTTCEFWIHKRCAFSPFIIPAPIYHHHPLNLIYSIPDNHRYFNRFCAICSKIVSVICWMYYCHRCTYFVHISCAKSTISMADEIEDGIDNEPDLVQFPLQNEESLLDLIMVQCGKLQANFQGEDKNSITTSTMPDGPNIIEEHWSHKNHPLERLQYTSSENDDDNNDTRGVLICDGCIQPITVSHPSYYACLKCDFFLHSFCATKLPQKLLPGESPFHPQHTLLLKTNKFYEFYCCDVCGYQTNGFYYYCKACRSVIDIRCVFLPTRIKHTSHKHPLVQGPSSNSMCSISNTRITPRGMEYACETCSSFKISILCVFYPRRMKHRYDDHPLTLRQPPFFYEGVFYCEICEEQVNNQVWLYHCGESCDHSFHYDCLRWVETVKLGVTYEICINDMIHKFRLLLKRPIRKNSPLFICRFCGNENDLFLECDGCETSACCWCFWYIFEKEFISRSKHL